MEVRIVIADIMDSLTKTNLAAKNVGHSMLKTPHMELLCTCWIYIRQPPYMCHSFSSCSLLLLLLSLRLESSWQSFHDMTWLILDLGTQYFNIWETFHAHCRECILRGITSASIREINSHLKGTSGGPRHCIWTPDCPLKLYCYLALDTPQGIHIVKNVYV